MGTPFPEPTDPAGSRAEVFLAYLDYFRSRSRPSSGPCPRPT
jgi:hypothetical protein